MAANGTAAVSQNRIRKPSGRVIRRLASVPPKPAPRKTPDEISATDALRRVSVKYWAAMPVIMGVDAAPIPVITRATISSSRLSLTAARAPPIVRHPSATTMICLRHRIRSPSRHMEGTKRAPPSSVLSVSQSAATGPIPYCCWRLGRRGVSMLVAIA